MSFVKDPDYMEKMRGSIDGRKFLSKSPFRSGPFLLTTALFLTDLLYDLYLLFWRTDGIGMPGSLPFLYIALYLVSAYSAALINLGRLRGDIYKEDSVAEIPAGSALDIALGVAVSSTLGLLSYFFMGTLLLLGYLGRLMAHAGK